MLHSGYYILAILLAVTAQAYKGPDLPPGPYCGLDFKCCRGREDGCSHQIIGTLCYCDEFCNRTVSHDDCCPDYEEVCLGITPPPPPPEPILSCVHDGQYYGDGDTRTENCNTCECKGLSRTKAAWVCTEDKCLMDEELIQEINRRQLGWRAANYSQFWGHKLDEGLRLRLGTMPLNEQSRRMSAIKYTEDNVSPDSFDSRTEWPEYISPVVDQGWCGSDWAISTAAVASDRFNIQSLGAEAVQLSPQQLLSCSRRGQHGCEGGHIDRAWQYLRKIGLVDEACLPYRAANATQCPIPERATLQGAGCRAPPNKVRTELYKTSPPSKLAAEHDIKYDILTSGPVQALMRVHQDLFHYRDGVYRYQGQAGLASDGDSGLHSVRIVGWGQDRGTKYWIVANSWGTEWGENGYFRIARGENESEIESFVITVLARVIEANVDVVRK